MFVTVTSYILEGKTLNAVDIFITLGLYTNIRLSLTLFLPFGVQLISESIVCLKRIQVSLSRIAFYLGLV